MTATIQDHQQQIRDVVSEVLEIDPAELTEDGLFAAEYGADSLRTIEILAVLEKTFGVPIDQSELPRMVNLAGVYAVVAEAAGWE